MLHTLIVSVSVCLSTGGVSDSDTVTVWHCDNVTLWHCDTVTLWNCDTVTGQKRWWRIKDVRALSSLPGGHTATSSLIISFTLGAGPQGVSTHFFHFRWSQYKSKEFHLRGVQLLCICCRSCIALKHNITVVGARRGQSQIVRPRLITLHSSHMKPHCRSQRHHHRQHFHSGSLVDIVSNL